MRLLVLASLLVFASCKTSPKPRGQSNSTKTGVTESREDDRTEGSEGDVQAQTSTDDEVPQPDPVDGDEGDQNTDTTDSTDTTTPADDSDQDSTTTTTPSTPQECDPAPLVEQHGLTDAEKDEVISVHNQLRGAVKVTDIEWSDELAKYAQTWLNEIKDNRGCKAAHRPADDCKWKRIYGESLYTGYVDRPIHYALDYWSKQKENYEEGTKVTKRESDDPVVGNYLQMVWAKTARVGCGKVQCQYRTGIIRMVACNYDPVGYINNELPYP